MLVCTYSLVPRPRPLVPRPHPLTRRHAWGECVDKSWDMKTFVQWHQEHNIKYIHTRTVLTVEYKKEWSNTDNPWQTEWSTCTPRSTQMKCSGQVLNLGRIFPPLDWWELCMRAERDMDHYSHHPPRSYLTAMKTEIKSGASWISTRLRPDTKLVKFI